MPADATPEPEPAQPEPVRSPAKAAKVVRPTPDTYWLLKGSTLFGITLLGGLYVRGEENVPASGPVLLVSNHVSYLDPVSIGDASPRRVVFMAKQEIFQVAPLGFLLRGVDSFPVRRGAADRQAVKTALAMLEEGRVVCIFPEGTRWTGPDLGPAESGAALFALKTGCPVVPVYVDGSARMLDLKGRLHRARITVSFGAPFTFPKGRADRETLDRSGREMMAAIARTRDEMASQPARRIWPHRLPPPREGSRARR